MRRILCFIGWHTWKWRLYGPDKKPRFDIPADATCEHCGARYEEN